MAQRIKTTKEKIGKDYYAAVFRFQNLFGDFHEYHYKTIKNKEDTEKLIEKCLNSIKELKVRHGNKPILVTSDSVTFLEKVAQLEGVHIIPGTLVHMDGSKTDIQKNTYDTYLKSFLDFYMISEAQKIYRIGTPYMYKSAFPVYAAKVHHIPFESITI